MDASFNSLKDRIKNLKRERDTLVRELQTDKANLQKQDSRIQARQDQYDKMSETANFLEEKLEAYD